MSSVPTLAYWRYRGYAQPMKLLLKYTSTQFNDKIYECGQEWTKESFIEWHKDKHSLGLDFPNLPYYIEGDLKLTQSLAILRYLGRKHGLVATDNKSQAKQEMIEQQFHDLLTKWFETIFPETPESKSNAIKVVEPYLEGLSKCLATSEWFVGNTVSYVDFLAYESLDWMKIFSAETFNRFDNLVKYNQRFESLPQIKAYLKSDECIKWPLFVPIQAWDQKRQ